VLAGSVGASEELARAAGNALALVEGVLGSAPAKRTAEIARTGVLQPRTLPLCPLATNYRGGSSCRVGTYDVSKEQTLTSRPVLAIIRGLLASTLGTSLPQQLYSVFDPLGASIRLYIVCNLRAGSRAPSWAKRETSPQARAPAEPFGGVRRSFHPLETKHGRQLVWGRRAHSRDRFRDASLVQHGLARRTPAMGLGARSARRAQDPGPPVYRSRSRSAEDPFPVRHASDSRRTGSSWS
jgi:hypothetical protein